MNDLGWFHRRCGPQHRERSHRLVLDDRLRVKVACHGPTGLGMLELEFASSWRAETAPRKRCKACVGTEGRAG